MKTPKHKPNGRQIAGATILVTGGTGSFGNAVINRLLQEQCKEIRVFSRDEKKQHDMRLKYQGSPIKYFIGDVRDRHSIDFAMRGVDLVFHAAALKQVPTAEFFPMQAVQTNVLGSTNVIECAIDNAVKAVVCLSTDKAVMPVNAMGMTKALMEKMLQSIVRLGAAGNTTVCCVRYGNVMYSRGSAIPLFVEQILSKQPITITDGSMTRFMLTMPNAVDLILFALQEGRSGDTFIRKSPGCTVDQLARCLMKIFEARVPVKRIGIRFGEKVDETLATAGEVQRAKDFGSYLQIPPETDDLNYQKYYSEGHPEATDYTSRSTAQLSDKELEKLLLSLAEIQEALNGAQKKAA